MKLALFEVRNDEMDQILELKRAHQLELEIHKSILSIDNIDLLDGATGISTLAGTKLNRELLDILLAKGIRHVSLRCVGTDHVDMEYAKEIGINVKSAFYPPNAVADFTVMLMLIALRKYKPAMWRQNVNDYSLFGLQGRNVNSRTIGIIGTGKIGKQVIKNLSGFGCKLIAYDGYQDEEIKQYAEYVSLEELYHKSDIITIHVPLTAQNEAMINAETIAKMKDGVILINTSRGELMSVNDLIEGIESEKIGSLAMDVFENDLTIYHRNHVCDILKNKDMAYLRQFPNVILTQHMAFYTQESVNSMVQCGIEGLL